MYSRDLSGFCVRFSYSWLDDLNFLQKKVDNNAGEILVIKHPHQSNYNNKLGFISVETVKIIESIYVTRVIHLHTLLL